MTTYNFKIDSLTCDQSNPNYPNLVKTVGVTVSAVTETEGTLSVSTIVDVSPSESFTPYQELTQSQIQSWIPSQVLADLQSMLEKQISDIQLEKVKEQPLPWLAK
jgi:hypothetical protein